MTDRERQAGDVVRAKDTVIRDAADYIKELFKDNADGHDYDHSIRVYRNAMKIASQEGDCDTFVVALAALLHDVDDHKLFHTEDNENARKFLADQGIDKDITEKICTAISEVSFSKNRDRHPSTVEGEIVQDADRLDALVQWVLSELLHMEGGMAVHLMKAWSISMTNSCSLRT